MTFLFHPKKKVCVCVYTYTCTEHMGWIIIQDFNPDSTSWEQVFLKVKLIFVLQKLPFSLPLKHTLYSDTHIQVQLGFLNYCVWNGSSEEILKIHLGTVILPWCCSWLEFRKPWERILTSQSSHKRKNHVVSHLFCFSSSHNLFSFVFIFYMFTCKRCFITISAIKQTWGKTPVQFFCLFAFVLLGPENNLSYSILGAFYLWWWLHYHNPTVKNCFDCLPAMSDARVIRDWK